LREGEQTMATTMSKTAYENSVSYHLPTMELKRKSILGYLEALVDADICHKMSYRGYFRTEELENEIAFTMGWVKEVAGRLHEENRIAIDYEQFHKVRQTVLNMNAKGYIRLSKSHKGFKILKIA
jgi:hypothetical protein